MKSFFHCMDKVAMVSFHQKRWTSQTYVFCRFVFFTTHSAEGILRDSHQMLPVSKSRLMTTAEASQVSAFSLGKGRFDLLIRERRVHLLQPLVLDGRGATGTADESSQCSRFKYVVGLTLCSTQFSLVVS